MFPILHETLSCGEERIALVLRPGSSRRKKIAIRVLQDGHAEVLVPPGCSSQRALQAANNKVEWILKHVRAARALPRPQPLLYVNGERHRYLGATPVLEVIDLIALSRTAQSERFVPRSPKVVYLPEENRLVIRLPAPVPATVRKALLEWYKTEAYRVIGERLTFLSTGIPWLRNLPPWRVKTMRRRWGSCTAQGLLTFNTHLIKAPLECIDYVILHELAHLKEHNHSPRFYRVLEDLLPDWKVCRKKLDTEAPFLLELF